MTILRVCTAAVFLALCCGSVAADDALPDATQLRAQGLHARLDPATRDVRIQELAGWITTMNATDPEHLRAVQGDVQFALMLIVDPEIYATLAPETIEAVDNALESIFDLEEINRSTQWEPLIYAYGFFNRDITPGQIAVVRNEVAALTQDQRNKIYHVFPHTVDAVTKPLTMGGLESPEATREALALVVPMMKAALLQDAMPGRAFHPPSHAVLVLGPLFERWPADTPEGKIIRDHVATRDDLIALLMRQLSSVALPDREPDRLERIYFGRTGRYAANALVRLDAREAVPALREEHTRFSTPAQEDREPVRYARRALIALGDPVERAALEATLQTDPDTARDTAVWLCRNGHNETAAYGQELLAKLLDCTPEEAMEKHFRALLSDSK